MPSAFFSRLLGLPYVMLRGWAVESEFLDISYNIPDFSLSTHLQLRKELDPFRRLIRENDQVNAQNILSLTANVHGDAIAEFMFVRAVFLNAIFSGEMDPDSFNRVQDFLDDYSDPGRARTLRALLESWAT